MMSDIRSIDLLGVEVASATSAAALAELERLAEHQAPVLVAYVNAHTLNLAAGDPSYEALLKSADLVLNDGIGVSIAARVQGHRFPENLNGSDFNPRILELAAARRWSVFFLGASPGVAEEAARRLKDRIPDLVVAGTKDGFFPRTEDSTVAEAIRKSGASVVMVAMGNPLQEMWLRDNLQRSGAKIGVGVGAFFDFSAQNVRRAPAWVNRMGIEWVFRLLQEPRRLWRRYVVGNPVFLFRVLRRRFFG